MHVCDDGHDDVAYTVNRCPVCDVMKERDALETKLAERDETIDQLEGTVADLDFKLEECQNT